MNKKKCKSKSCYDNSHSFVVVGIVLASTVPRKRKRGSAGVGAATAVLVSDSAGSTSTGVGSSSSGSSSSSALRSIASPSPSSSPSTLMSTSSSRGGGIPPRCGVTGVVVVPVVGGRDLRCSRRCRILCTYSLANFLIFAFFSSDNASSLFSLKLDDFFSFSAMMCVSCLCCGS